MKPKLTEKYCTKCKCTHPISEFYKRKNYGDGYMSYCKATRDVRVKGVNPEGEKFCQHCKKNHPLSEFYHKAENKDGFDNKCKEYRKRYIPSFANKMPINDRFFNVHQNENWIC